MASIPSDLKSATPEHMTPTARQSGGLVMMVAGGLILGSIGVFVHESGAHPLTAVLFRCAFGALALGVYALATRQVAALRLTPAVMPAALATGVLMVLNWALFFAAIQQTTIAIATVVFHVQPFWVMALGVLLLKERSSRLGWFAVAVALLGLAMATGLFERSPEAFDRRFLLGIACALGASLCYAVVTLVAKTQRQISALGLSMWQCAVGTVALCWWPFVAGLPAGGQAWLWLAGLGVIHTALAYVLLYGGMRRLSANRIAILQFVYPVAAILFDMIIYGRMLSMVQGLGVVLMGLAVWAAGLSRRSG